jgi:anion-transporting  ArsA/GET3 family ATPase
LTISPPDRATMDNDTPTAESEKKTPETSFSELFKKRIVFVVGKGGVGKTTISVALGMIAAEQGKKVLIVEVGNADNVGPLFDAGTLPNTPTKIANNLWGASINPKTVLKDYMHVEVGVNSNIFTSLTEATPGLKEVMTLGQIWRWEQEKDDRDQSTYDLIIVDAPATGHGLSLLKVPQTLIDMLGVGPITHQTQAVLDLLRNPEKTWLTVATLPEELPVNESITFQKTALEELKMSVQVTFINAIYPTLFNEQDQAVINQLMDNFENQSSDIKPLLVSANKRIIRREVQKVYINHLKQNAAGLIMEIPFYFTNHLRLAEIRKISQHLMANPQ